MRHPEICIPRSIPSRQLLLFVCFTGCASAVEAGCLSKCITIESSASTPMRSNRSSYTSADAIGQNMGVINTRMRLPSSKSYSIRVSADARPAACAVRYFGMTCMTGLPTNPKQSRPGGVSSMALSAL
jgi:hypothetical protein